VRGLLWTFTPLNNNGGYSLRSRAVPRLSPVVSDAVQSPVLPCQFLSLDPRRWGLIWNQAITTGLSPAKMSRFCGNKSGGTPPPWALRVLVRVVCVVAIACALSFEFASVLVSFSCRCWCFVSLSVFVCVCVESLMSHVCPFSYYPFSLSNSSWFYFLDVAFYTVNVSDRGDVVIWLRWWEGMDKMEQESTAVWTCSFHMLVVYQRKSNGYLRQPIAGDNPNQKMIPASTTKPGFPFWSFPFQLVLYF